MNFKTGKSLFVTHLLCKVTVVSVYSAEHASKCGVSLAAGTRTVLCVNFKKKKKKHVDVISMVHR